MKTLYLLRHAKAGPPPPGAGDFDRTLDGRGREARDDMASYCQERGIKPDLIVCSAAVRTRETAEAFLEMWGDEVVVEFDQRIYEAAPEVLLSRLDEVSPDVERVMLIGHNPGIHSIALWLSVPSRSKARQSMESRFAPGALCELAARDDGLRGLESAAFDLVRFVSPGDL